MMVGENLAIVSHAGSMGTTREELSSRGPAFAKALRLGHAACGRASVEAGVNGQSK